MVISTNWIKENYLKFNKLYWNNKLPNNIEFKVSRSRNTWGFASFNYDFKNNNIIPIQITISNYYDSPENVKLTTLLHEMIHIADYTFHPEHFVKNHRRVSGRYYDAHGYWFKSEANRLAKFGWNIEKFVTTEEKNLSLLSERSIHCIENKKNKALICGVIGKTSVWWFKTDIDKVNTVLKTINSINWYSIGGIKNIKFYTFDNEYLASKRSCANRISGYRTNIIEFRDILKRYKATDYYVKIKLTA